MTDEYLLTVSVGLAIREGATGGAAADGPSSDEVLFAGNMLGDLLSGETPINQAELWRVIQALAEVSDKWIDPEADPLGSAPYQYLEGMIKELGGLLDEYLPEQAPDLQKWFDLRLLAHCARRTVHREEQKPPLFPWISNLRVLTGTTVGSLLYKSGRFLQAFGRRMR